ncbi:LysM peptidoglycan-binding domain-containing protein [Enterococcus hirae]|uniref:LysM peptidoglycan-binding domain-containing protein n=1 Tax=Enterococcus hirae TaxID=1354 RepID=UPI001917DBAA|nr:LysM peptidoglycan-binding domain-containing protein [Enterococcus hirae]EMF0308434.1 LysM peptidoglycan-binding domain-containing protein [Enterococcus hirae]QQU11782.1 LysM peptidoglycan-binding domain-containing protein [Enterococcus hirae]
MGNFLFAIGLLGFFFGIGFLIYSFFSKKKIARKKIIIGIISAFAAMVCGVTISPPDTEQSATNNTTVQSTTISSTTRDTSSESNEKEEQKAKEEDERKQQEEKRKAEEQRQQAIAQEQAVAQAQQQNNQQTVLITPTGKKYHNHVCGNGNYSPTTLQEALNRGLTPCEKCYGGEPTNPSEEVAPSSTTQVEPLPSSESTIETNPSSSEISSNSIITVQQGEGPKQLAERAGITINQLFELNGLDPNNYMIYPGQQLKIK